MLIMIDNYDSFTYNIVHYFCELGVNVKVFRNDEITALAVKKLSPDYIVLSPGPCNPDKSGICMEVIEVFAGKIPILGVCLGHQCIGQFFGGRIVHAKKIMHGKVGSIYHQNQGVFVNLKNPLSMVQYNSLIVDWDVPDCLEVTAWTQSNNSKFELMGLRHKSMLIEGVQFHPESIMSEQGKLLFNNFLQYLR